MKGRVSLRRFLSQMSRGAVAVLCVALIALGDPALLAGQQAGPTEQAPKIPNDQLDSLVAPIALYPDPLLAQVLAASTYPLEIIQLQQFLDKNKDLKDKALSEAVLKQNWDPTVQAMAALPDVVKRLADDIQWTTDLGNAFLAQQSDVMDAVQRMRKTAQDKGALKSDDKMAVETKVVESKSIIVIEQANPQVVYVPSYNPVVVWGSPVYPYPPVYYPPPGYYATGVFLSFGVGVAIGAAWGGAWCCGARWGSNNNNNITINNNNTFVRNSNRQNINQNISGGNRTGGGGNWQHNPQHRGGAPYSDRATANRYGGTARGESTTNRQNRAGQGQGQSGGRQQPGVSNRAGGGASPAPANRPGGGGASPAPANRPGGGGASPAPANRPGGGGASPAPANRPGGGGADRIGGQDVSRSGGGGKDALGGGPKGGYNGSNTGASSRRGGSSIGSGGGGAGGGARGGAGGGARGGGGGAAPRRP